MAKKARKNTPKVKTQNGIFNKINFTESYTSLIMGAIVVLIVGILFILFAKVNKNMQTSSIKETAKLEEQKSQDSNTSSTYTIRPGDDLWSISETVYNNGYKWIEIAKINNLDNPGVIYAGNELTIPPAENTQTSQPQDTAIQNNSITGNAYAVKSGDCLWDIAVRAYGDGYKWPEIANANNLSNPDLIFTDSTLIIPR